MNKANDQRCTTVLLADARCLEDKAVFSHFFLTVNAERQRDIVSRRFDKDKVLSLAGGLLLDMLLKRWDITAQIEHDSRGKPVVQGHPEVFVSLTHAYPYAAAVISDRPCGIDLENRSRNPEAIARKYFNEKEKAFSGTDQGKITDLWCRKECCIKFGLPGDIRFIDPFTIPEDYRYCSFPLDGFSFEVLIPKGDLAYHVVKFQEDLL